MNGDLVVERVLGALGVHSRMVDTGVAPHHVYDSGGPGEIVAFLPGLSDSASSLTPVLLGLRRRGHRIIVVDGAGHGLSGQARGRYSVELHLASTTVALDAVLDAPALLVGNSLGGAAALHYARERPARVRGLFLTSPAGARHDDETVDGLRAAFRLRGLADAHRFIGRVLHRPSWLTGPLARVVLARNRSAGIADLVEGLSADHAITDVTGIAAPIRLVWGRSERLLPPAALAYYRAVLPPHATVIEPDGFGHCPHLDDPARLTRMIAAFARCCSRSG